MKNRESKWKKEKNWQQKLKERERKYKMRREIETDEKRKE